MMLPRWIPFAVAFWVIAFGILRMRIAMRKELPGDEERPNFRKGGYYARSKRSHAIYGVAYLALGVYCIAMGFGYQVHFLGSCMGQETSGEESPRRIEGGVPAQTAPSPATEEGLAQ
ncbi:MAG: hypothetical protein GY811_26225 [Myxococcales bacterium]|nr:hypothetical protein [Myxococcales bacterium]